MVEYQFEGSKGVRLGWFLDSFEGTHRHHFCQVSCNLHMWFRRYQLRTEEDRICHFSACCCYTSWMF
ncbi:unknown protein [Oryza sativa Japonica Group]|uniref:Uncharacterized protein n=1 Tax=Oryza sativa subsp. japonica TaxID=39947 RepID=Q5VN94_ORYSJ|nr:unknown protein [Oryza sativa Japonica Group]